MVKQNYNVSRSLSPLTLILVLKILVQFTSACTITANAYAPLRLFSWTTAFTQTVETNFASLFTIAACPTVICSIKQSDCTNALGTTQVYQSGSASYLYSNSHHCGFTENICYVCQQGAIKAQISTTVQLIQHVCCNGISNSGSIIANPHTVTYAAGQNFQIQLIGDVYQIAVTCNPDSYTSDITDDTCSTVNPQLTKQNDANGDALVVQGPRSVVNGWITYACMTVKIFIGSIEMGSQQVERYIIQMPDAGGSSSPCPLSIKSGITLTYSYDVPQVYTSPNWQTVMFGQYYINGFNVCTLSQYTFKVLEDKSLDDIDPTLVQITRDLADITKDGEFQINLNKIIANQQFLIQIKVNNQFIYVLLGLHAQVNCKLTINYPAISSYANFTTTPVSTMTTDWQQFVDIQQLITWQSHITTCPITFALDDADSNHQLVGSVFSVDIGKIINLSNVKFKASVPGVNRDSSDFVLKTNCVAVVWNTGANIFTQTTIVYVPASVAGSTQNVIDLTTLATVHRGDVCLTTYTIEWADTTAYNTVSENYLFIQGAQNDQLTVNANIQKTMTNDIKIKATNADTSTLSPAIKVNEFCKPLVKDSTYPVSIIKSVIQTYSASYFDVVLATGLWPVQSHTSGSGCDRAIKIFKNGVEITSPTTHEQVSSGLKMKLNEVYSSTYLFKIKYIYEPDSAYNDVNLVSTISVSIICTNTSNSFTITTPSANNIQNFNLQNPPVNAPFDVSSLTISQTSGCQPTSIQLSNALAPTNSPSYFSPTTFTSFGSPPFVFGNTNQIEWKYTFYLRITFDGGYQFLQIGGQYLFELITQFVCTGSPTVTVPDPTVFDIILKKDASNQNSPIDSALISRYLSDSWNCIIKNFDLLDASKAPAPSTPVQVTVMNPANSSFFITDTTNSMVTDYFLRGKTDNGGQGDLGIKIHVCDEDSLSLVSSLYAIKLTLALNQFTSPFINVYIVKSESELKAMVSGPDCSVCLPNMQMGVYDEQDQIYSTSYIDSPTPQLIVDTSTNLAKRSLKVKYSFQNDCSFIKSVSFPFYLEICGSESITLTGAQNLTYKVVIDEDTDDIEISANEINSWFTTSNDLCNLTIFLAPKKTGSDGIQTASWNNYVSLDLNSGGLKIKHLGTYPNAPSDQQYNYNIEIYVRALTAGKIESYKQIQVQFIYPGPPYFIQQLQDFDIKVFEAKIRLDQQGPTLEYRSSGVVDDFDNAITYDSITIDPAVPCNCLEVKQNGGDQSFSLIVDITKITSDDVGSYGVSVVLKNKRVSQTYTMRLNLEYVKYVMFMKEELTPNVIEEIIQINTTKISNPWRFEEESSDNPVKLKIKVINRNGMMEIEFNQELLVPAYIDRITESNVSQEGLSQNASSGLMRQTLQLSQIIVEEILDFRIEVYDNDQADDPIEYKLKMESWDERQMTIFINFTDPFQVSRGLKNDKAICQVLKLDLFVSKAYNQKLQKDNANMEKLVPRQLPFGETEEQLIRNSIMLKKLITSVFILQIVLQLCLKGLLSQLWELFYTLQIIVYLSIYDIRFPLNAEFYTNEFKNLIEFELLNPDSLMQLITGNDNYHLMNVILGKDQSHDELSKSALNELSFVIYAICAFATFIIVLWLISQITLCTKQIKKVYTKVKVKFLFNGLIRSFSISFIKLAISFGKQIDLFFANDPDQSKGDRYLGFVIFTFLFFYPLICWYILLKNKDSLDHPSISKKISNLYQGVRTSHKLKSYLMYYPLWLLRRIIFVAVPTFLRAFPYHQVQLLIFLTSLYVCSYVGIRPHWESLRVKTEVFNELMILIACYHLVCFSEFNLEGKAQYFSGQSFIWLLCLVIIVNVGLMCSKIYYRFKKKTRKATKSTDLEADVENKTKDKRRKLTEIELRIRRELKNFNKDKTKTKKVTNEENVLNQNTIIGGLEGILKDNPEDEIKNKRKRHKRGNQKKKNDLKKEKEKKKEEERKQMEDEIKKGVQDYITKHTSKPIDDGTNLEGLLRSFDNDVQDFRIDESQQSPTPVIIQKLGQKQKQATRNIKGFTKLIGVISQEDSQYHQTGRRGYKNSRSIFDNKPSAQQLPTIKIAHFQNDYITNSKYMTQPFGSAMSIKQLDNETLGTNPTPKRTDRAPRKIMTAQMGIIESSVSPRNNQKNQKVAMDMANQSRNKYNNAYLKSVNHEMKKWFKND